ncbi:hypothetical protein HUT09_34440 (plasmid) [Streptomyces microflavus]|uniref:Transposase n=1 Tax=Streptomyces microflavus TaxID=1919 RepID=A0A7H8MZV5_STRMI|nr:hypothetical protein [Streptomyces microflavus]QKW47676.1 hypothetical protein HUT09_34440 [Streptomyces microflavus]
MAQIVAVGDLEEGFFVLAKLVLEEGPAFLKDAREGHDRRSLALRRRVPAEGVNTKTTRIARQMHGRAGFKLLRHRMLLTRRHHRM